MIDFAKNFFLYLRDFIFKMINALLSIAGDLVAFIINALPIPQALKDFVLVWPADNWFLPLLRETGVTDGIKIIIAGYILGLTIKAVRMALAFVRPGM